jgi:FixJ family two-component response regulator
MVAVTALKEGAADFVPKDVGFERSLPDVVARVLEKHAEARAAREEQKRLVEQVRQLEITLDAHSRDLRRALEESEVLSRVGHAVALLADLSAALDAVAEHTAQLLQAESAAVFIRRGAEDVLVSVWGVLSYPTGSKLTDFPAKLAGQFGAIATAAIRQDDEHIGWLWVGRARAHAFDDREQRMLDTVADLTALSIARWRATEKVNRLQAGNGGPGTPTAGRATLVPTEAVPEGPDAWDTPPSEAMSEPHRSESGPPTVLVVDDSDKVLLQARMTLQESMKVLTATSGRLAIEKYAATRPAVVLIDLVMPEMDGFATLVELQKLGCSTSIAIGLRGDARVHERARRAGFATVVEKPFREGELAAQVMAVLNVGEPIATNYLGDDAGYPVLTLPNPSPRTLPRLLPMLDRQLRSLAENNVDHLILDCAPVTTVTPEHVTMLVRVFSEAAMLGIRTAICAPDAGLVAKLRHILELRDARYVDTREAAKAALN